MMTSASTCSDWLRIIVLRIRVERLEQRERLLVHRGMVADHGFCKLAYRRALGDREREVSVANVDDVGDVGHVGAIEDDVGNLYEIRLGDYIGENTGRVIGIDKDRIRLEQIAQN